jgi:hypothetical protein
MNFINENGFIVFGEVVVIHSATNVGKIIKRITIIGQTFFLNLSQIQTKFSSFCKTPSKNQSEKYLCYIWSIKFLILIGKYPEKTNHEGEINMTDKKDIVPMEIFMGIAWEAEMVKNLLENEGIKAFIKDDIIGTIAPFYTTPGLGSVKLVVSSDDYEKAGAIVAEFQKNRSDK